MASSRRAFETPAELLVELPSDENFRSTIFGTRSPGGHGPAARVPELKALLLRHRQAVADDEMSADFQKILEPVVLAERRGHGVIEAAEIYSGLIGGMN
ncbi:MAG: hypothetical protein NW223_21650 [Hyphomicrobiaceae bacterium]|nr:hypothetical protein [Hyphomicrobiaceae bacterium]